MDKGKGRLLGFPWLDCTSTTRGWNGDPETSPGHLHGAKRSSTPQREIIILPGALFCQRLCPALEEQLPRNDT